MTSEAAALPRDPIEACVHCGFCLPSCPTYLLWGEEMDSPRGRIYLMKAGRDGRLPLSGSFVGHMDACLGCLACVTACPSGVQYGSLIEHERARIEGGFRRSLGDRLFRRALFAVLPYPNRLRLLSWPLAILTALRPRLERSAIFDRLPARWRAAISLAPARARPAKASPRPRPAETSGPAASESSGDGPRVGLLTGCVQRVMFAHVNDAGARLLAAEGCRVIAPPTQGCCGALALHAGLEAEARSWARRLIEAFEPAGVERIAATAAGCGSCMKDYGRLLQDDPAWAERARRFAERVRDVTELLAELGPSRGPRHALRLRVAYHDACHLAHGQGVRRAPRALLEAVPGLELLPLAEEDICCGSAGIYNLVQPEAAEALGARKARHIEAAAPDAVATTNPGCLLQIAAAGRRSGRDRPVFHVVELLDASMRGVPPDDLIGPARGRGASHS